MKAKVKAFFRFVLFLPDKALGAAIFFIPLAIGLSSLRTPCYWAGGLLFLSLFSVLRPLAIVTFATGWGISWWYFLHAFFDAAMKPHTIIGYIGTGLIGIVLTGVLLFATLLSFGLLLVRRVPHNESLAGSEGNYEEGVGEELPHDEFDPYIVLAINRDASKEEIRKQYRLMMQQYHPDKVEHLGNDLRALAKEKTIEIQRAYEMLAA